MKKKLSKNVIIGIILSVISGITLLIALGSIIYFSIKYKKFTSDILVAIISTIAILISFISCLLTVRRLIIFEE